uniref:Uncharacterized protein n=1 Tax=Leptocylindrus danicus TaxID=163516 RepID=A0A7S2P408_9STRA|mmetsp:Transcript_227/g.310  ORF Transcript_227/g.310 Transcript_227/m.310 type:complete len:204 (+) Transcript_227:428-1039(+)
MLLLDNISRHPIQSQKNIYSGQKKEIPRILTGIGDLYVSIEKYSYGVDAYTRAIPFREAQLEESKTNANETEKLRQHRLLCEANVLVAETLLRCNPDEDVVVQHNENDNEDKTLLVSATERIDFARGYYDKARSDLQDAVFLMGKIASDAVGASARTCSIGFGKEKEDICFLATILMGVGNTLADLDETAKVEDRDAKKSRKK